MRDPIGGWKLIYYNITIHAAMIVTFPIVITTYPQTNEQIQLQEQQGFITLCQNLQLMHVVLLSLQAVNYWFVERIPDAVIERLSQML